MPYKPPVSEPLAIVGSSCRFAGGATSPSQLWRLLENPQDLSKLVPSDRFNIEAFYHPDGEYHGTTNSPKAYFLEQDPRVFDSAFFNITPKEAEAMDPQQRLLLEVVYEALESAGYTLEQYAGTDTAVFAGVMTGDYETLSARDDLTPSQYYATGNSKAIMSNRISYFFDFHGPSMTIDTACSSSLVALHQAVLALRSGESSMACVAGVNLILTPEQFEIESNLHMLSPSGHCRMWDAAADGYARGEGVAAIFVKLLSKAVVDGDRIEAIIRETGVNSDGRTKGITMPNSAAQTRLIRDTYRRADLDPADSEDRCQYFEAHGTGTQAGDPREAAAIQNAFFPRAASATQESRGFLDADIEPKSVNTADSHGTHSSPKLLVGSVKTIIGHTEGAAGLAGLLKVVQSIHHGMAPPNLHFDSLSPLVEPFYNNLEISKILRPWPNVPHGQPRRASVNSFGFGGTNAHAIVEQFIPELHSAEMPESYLDKRASVPRGSDKLPRIILPVLLSANSRKMLLVVAERHRDHLIKNPMINLAELAWHSYQRRTAFQYRMAISSSDMPSLIANLNGLIQMADESSATSFGTRAQLESKAPKSLGIFTGQGAQWPTMSRELLLTNKEYAQSIDTLDEILTTIPDPPSWTLRDQILADRDVSRVQLPEVSQPLCTALQLAFVDLLRNMGITFDTVIGHSSGEIAAAYVACRITRRDAIVISYYRGKYANLAAGSEGTKGGMMAVVLTRLEAEAICNKDEYRDSVFIAAHNGPSNFTLSGDLEKLSQIKDELTSQGQFARTLQVGVAYHSPQMNNSATRYLEALKRCAISSSSPTSDVVWASSVYGRTCRDEDLSAYYWIDNMVRPVLFTEALEDALMSRGSFDCVIEVGPHPALKGPVTQTMTAHGSPSIPYMSMLNRNENDSVAFSKFLGSMWVNFRSSASQIRRFVEGAGHIDLLRSRLDCLPTYPWDHSQKHWRESRISRQLHQRSDPPNELLGFRTRDDNDHELRWRNILKADKLPWTQGHKFQGQALLPASAYCIMAFDAARVLANHHKTSIIEIRDSAFDNGIAIESDSPGVEVLSSLKVSRSGKQNSSQSVIEAQFTITSTPADGSIKMKLNFSARIRILPGKATAEALPSRQADRAETLPVRPSEFYRMMLNSGLDYSGPFKGLVSLERRLNFASGSVKKLHSEDSTQLSISPATLDSCLQSCFVSYASPGDNSLWTSFLPTSIKMIRFNVAICEIQPGDASMLTTDAWLIDAGENALPKGSPASFTADIDIFNSRGFMEIQIEGLTVTSLTITKPEDDHEMYLTTVMDIDPEDQIVQCNGPESRLTDHVLVETCKRVASFYAEIGTEANPWPTETSLSLEAFVHASPYSSFLRRIQAAGIESPLRLPVEVPRIIREASQLLSFQKHISRVTHQIAHKYARMNVLAITDPSLDLDRYLLDGLKSGFQSYTATISDPTKGLESLLTLFPSKRSKIIVEEVDTILKPDKLGSRQHMYDLAVVSVSIIEKHGLGAAIKSIRELVRPNGFLILAHEVHDPAQCGLYSGLAAQSLTPLGWSNALNDSGFSQVPGNSTQYFHDRYSLTLRQADSSYELPSPSSRSPESRNVDHLLVLGGLTPPTAGIVAAITAQIAPSCTTFTVSAALDDIQPEMMTGVNNIIFLGDLDEPVLSSMSSSRLRILQKLIKPDCLCLWVTLRATSDNPNHAASIGLLRTVACEVPGIIVRVLDIESLEDAPYTVCRAFTRLLRDIWVKERHPNWLSTLEPEVYIKNRRRLVPRVLPWKPANERLNANRRTISRAINSLEKAIEINPEKKPAGRGGQYTTSIHEIEDQVQGPLIHATYTSVSSIRLSSGDLAHLCTGQDISEGTTKMTLSRSITSIITSRSELGLDVDASVNQPVLMALLLRYIFSLRLLSSPPLPDILLIEPDDLLVECSQKILCEQEKALGLPTECSIRYLTADRARSTSNGHLSFIHPLSSKTSSTTLLSGRQTCVIDFSSHDSVISKVFSSAPGSESTSYSQDRLWHLHDNILPGLSESLWKKAVHLAIQKSSSLDPSQIANMISGPDLLDPAKHIGLFTVLDWRAERLIPHMVRPLIEPGIFSPEKTYVLVGLTRDIGQSLSRMLIRHGAAHIVLASRNPPDNNPCWKQELESTGANISIQSIDVTDASSVINIRELISDSMPPVGGIVNGAMVLDDRVFSEMNLETLTRVLDPKVKGSKNLDEIFNAPDLEFFILMSSFAAIGGHAGQSNYAAANMYMNGLAGARRERGLVGSVLNIGVIYGLGFLHREKDTLYKGLERDGYLPISERDLHHMFIEAVVAGRPVKGQVVDIVTGLQRFHFNNPNPMHWQTDPRFSHFTVAEGKDEMNTKSGKDQPSVKYLVAAAETAEEIMTVLIPAFVDYLEAQLQLSKHTVTGDDSISNLGVDSLAAVDIRSWFWKNTGCDVSILKIIDSGTIRKCKYSPTLISTSQT